MTRESPTCCLLCSCSDKSVKYKQVHAKALRDFLHESIRPTPYLYTYIMNLTDTEKLPADDDASFFSLCVNCDSWMRRQPGSCKVFLHADAVFLNIMFPGRYELPEERSCLRVIRNCCNQMLGNNMLVNIAPRAVVEFLSVYRVKFLPYTQHDAQSSGVTAKVKRKMHQKQHFRRHMVLIWWHRNRNSEFLSNKFTAKIIRKTVNHSEKK